MRSFPYSIHFAKPDSHAGRFSHQFEPTYSDLFPHITRFVWSPIVWVDGHRLKRNFKQSHLLVLDIDKDWQIEDAVDYVRRIKAWSIIGTTKSHTPQHHRFRLIMRWSQRITDGKLYEYNLERFIKTTPADPACRDAARFFYPCKEIVHHQEGRPIPVYAPKKPVRTPTTFTGSDDVPPWMADELSAGIPEGRRNRTAFRFAIHLAERNVEQTRAKQILAPILSPGFTESELDKTIWSGYRYKRGNA